MTNLKHILQYKHAKKINFLLCAMGAPFFGITSIAVYLTVAMMLETLDK